MNTIRDLGCDLNNLSVTLPYCFNWQQGILFYSSLMKSIQRKRFSFKIYMYGMSSVGFLCPILYYFYSSGRGVKKALASFTMFPFILLFHAKRKRCFLEEKHSGVFEFMTGVNEMNTNREQFYRCRYQSHFQTIHTRMFII